MAAVTLAVCSAVHAGDQVDLGVRRDTMSRRGLVVRDIAVGGMAGAIVSGGVLAYASAATSGGAQDWRPVLATGVGVGLLLGLTIGMIQANRHGQHEPARPTSDGLAFQEQHHDRSGVFIAELPAVRF